MLKEKRLDDKHLAGRRMWIAMMNALDLLGKEDLRLPKDRITSSSIPMDEDELGKVQEVARWTIVPLCDIVGKTVSL
jgi:hypothetical protein